MHLCSCAACLLALYCVDNAITWEDNSIKILLETLFRSHCTSSSIFHSFIHIAYYISVFYRMLQLAHNKHWVEKRRDRKRLTLKIDINSVDMTVQRINLTVSSKRVNSFDGNDTFNIHSLSLLSMEILFCVVWNAIDNFRSVWSSSSSPLIVCFHHSCSLHLLCCNSSDNSIRHSINCFSYLVVSGLVCSIIKYYQCLQYSSRSEESISWVCLCSLSEFCFFCLCIGMGGNSHTNGWKAHTNRNFWREWEKRRIWFGKSLFTVSIEIKFCQCYNKCKRADWIWFSSWSRCRSMMCMVSKINQSQSNQRTVRSTY